MTMDGRVHNVGKWDMLIAHPPCTYLSNVATRFFSLKCTEPEKVAELSEEIEKAQEKTRWIPMNDSFPTKAGSYLICTRDSYLGYRKIKLSYFDPKYAWDDVENYETVIAWMPLPEPYTEEKE